MSDTLVECVPNFSEGRDPAKIGAIAEAIRAGGGRILHQTSDIDHNRTVITFVARAGEVGEAAFRGVAKAAELIDLRAHQGVHPRIGAADVVPFIPLRGVTMQDCVEIAHAAGRRIWNELSVPVYFYETAALRPENAALPNVRRGGFEKLRGEAVANTVRRPDVGGPALHESAGASVVGARKLLIAFNAILNTADEGIAKEIARAVRASNGGVEKLRAIGVYLASRGRAQVSMNLIDFETTPMHAAMEAVRGQASRLGVAVESTELIGLAPAKALETAAAHYLNLQPFDLGRVLENAIDSCGM
jgi:glutamate formiminotransferase